MVHAPQPLRKLLNTRTIVLVLLAFLLVVGAFPGYSQGNWGWAKPPKVSGLRQIKALRQEPLPLPGWHPVDKQDTVKIGGQDWIRQDIERDAPSSGTTSDGMGADRAILLLLPQNSDTAHPQVEWADIDGWQRWTADSHQPLKFSTSSTATNPRSAQVTTRFFRGWTEQQTFAVVQWYALPQGGTPSIGQWFWADLLAQWQQRRVPWVAVCVLAPMEPLGELQQVYPLASSLAEEVQLALMKGAFSIDRNSMTNPS